MEQSCGLKNVTEVKQRYVKHMEAKNWKQD